MLLWAILYDLVSPTENYLRPQLTCLSPTFTQIPGENFNISYGDGEFLTGILGYEKVTLANITVDRQEIAVVDLAYWNGDNISSGLTGFGYPSLTSAFTEPIRQQIMSPTQPISPSTVQF